MALVDGSEGWGGAGALSAGLKRARSLSREAELLAGGMAVLAGAFLYPFLERLIHPVMPGCLFHRITGLPCLLCGMTRSLAATAHGDLAAAFRLHPLGPPLFLIIAVTAAFLAAELTFSRRILPRPGKNAWRHASRAALALLAVVWVARMIFLGFNI